MKEQPDTKHLSESKTGLEQEAFSSSSLYERMFGQWSHSLSSVNHVMVAWLAALGAANAAQPDEHLKIKKRP